MKNIKISLIVIAIVLSILIFDNRETVANVKNMEDDNACRHRAVDTCIVSYFELIARADKFNGDEVYFMGYLGVDSFDMVLYPSRSAYMLDDDTSSIVVMADEELKNKIARDRLFTYVGISGKFAIHRLASKKDKRQIRLGYLTISDIPQRVGERIMDESSITVGFTPGEVQEQ